MKRGRVAKVLAGAVATLALTATAIVPSALACNEEGPGLVSVRINAALSPAAAVNIGFEPFNGTLTINRIALNGTATWSENETPLLTGPVSIVGVILTTGDQATYLDNRGTLWLKYRFFDVDGVTVIGTGEGFVTLERVGDSEGKGSFQGSVTIAGAIKQFAGTGESELNALLPLQPLLPPTPPPTPLATADGRGWGGPDGDCGDDDLPGLKQNMDKTVVTGDKPGFDFEMATTVSTLNTLYSMDTKRLRQQRDARFRVMKAVKK